MYAGIITYALRASKKIIFWRLSRNFKPLFNPHEIYGSDTHSSFTVLLSIPELKVARTGYLAAL